MKNVFYLIIAILLSTSSIKAQTTTGTDFWLTFGTNSPFPLIAIDLQIRIVNGSTPNTVYIQFTELGGVTYPYFLTPQEVKTINLTSEQKEAVYNTSNGITAKSVRITSDYPITVYVLNQVSASTDATNVFPVTALGTEYYQISYTAGVWDAYAVVAIEDDTNIYHDGSSSPVATLQTGEIYYRTSTTDMTGAHITTNNPVAFFALNRGTLIPFDFTAMDCLMQQLAPVNTWGKNFFVPVSSLTVDRVRIVASENGTNIIQTGGEIKSAAGSQMSFTNLQAGQFVELEVTLGNNGCYIKADKRVGVCTYLTGSGYNGMSISDPAQAWLPAIEQSIPNALIAPFIPAGVTLLNAHYGLIVTKTLTKNDTRVSIGGAPSVPLSGGSWYDNNDADMSFYNMPLTNPDASYYFTNAAGLIVMCYGVGPVESYYYLAGSAMRDLDAAFYANDIHFQDLEENPFCENEVLFRAEIEGLHPDPESLKWFIDGVEETSARDQLEWSKTFATGEYEITMWVRYETDETVSKTGILKIETCGSNAGFYANDVYYENLPNTTICTKDVVNFRAEIEGINPNPGSLKWYIDGVEEIPAQDQLQWSKTLPTGVYQIEMWVRFENDETASIQSTLKVELFWVKIRNIQH